MVKLGSYSGWQRYVQDGAIPLLTLIIGANLLKGLRTSRTPKFMIIGIIVARYIVLHSVGIGVVKAAVRLNLVHADPLYQFVLLLQFAFSPAMNIGTMMQLFGKGEIGKEIAMSGRRCDWRRGSCYSKEYFSVLKPDPPFVETLLPEYPGPHICGR